MIILVTESTDGIDLTGSGVAISVVEGIIAVEGGGGVSDHGALTGLADDDHTQYHTDARGDARYWALSTDLATQAELDTHAADTTAVHGIADTSVLATDAEVATAVSDHAAAANPHPTYLTQAEGDAAYDALGAASSAVATHEADTTSVHGIADTSALATTASVAELARDALGTALTAGTGITVTPNDGADTITVASTITQYTDEMARDALGTALVAGTNVTITPNDGADTITIAASGGSGVVSPDTTPGSPDAYDYEFDATSSSLPSGWAWNNQGTSTYDERRGGGAIAAPSSGSSNLRIIEKAIPAGSAWTVEGKFTIHGSATGVLMGGITLRNSSNSKIASFGPRSVGNIRGLYWTNTTTYASDITADVPFIIAPTHYLRVVKNSATSYDLAVSNDGINYRTLAAAQNIEATTGTLDKLGFMVCPENSAVAGITCHWFRKTA